MKKSAVLIIFLVIAILVGAYFINTETPEKDSVWKDATYLEDTKIGTGEKTIDVEVIAGDRSITFEIHTDKETVGEALSEHNLIEGEKGPYGLYVKYVNGIKADYDENQTYWGFSKNGESLATGVDATALEDGAHYELVYTK